jgi:hypothetical protein
VLASIVACLLAAPVAEGSSGPPTVGIMPVAGGEGLTPADREHLRNRSRATLVGPWARVVENEELTGAEACEDHACRQRSLAAHGVTYWLTTEIDGRDRMYTVRTALWSVDDAEAVAHAEERCMVCGRAELAELVAAQSLVMRQFLSETGNDPAAVTVDARPRSARVAIDGTVVGKGHVTTQVSPGEHQVRVTARGYDPQALTLTTTRGVTRTVEVRLLHPELPGRWHRPLAFGALGAAVVAIGGGAAMVAADGEPVARKCGPDDPQNIDGDGDCRYVRRTLEAGVVVTALGVGLASAATTLLIIDGKRRSRHARAWSGTVRMHVSPTRVGVAGTF